DDVEAPADRDPDARRADVVESDHAKSVDPVDDGQDQDQPVPCPPEWALPADGHELEVHPLDPPAEHMHDQHVPDHQEHQHDPRHAHEHPPPELGAFAWGSFPTRAVQRCGPVPAAARRPRAPAGRVEGHQWTSLATCSSITIEIGIMPATKTAMVP